MTPGPQLTTLDRHVQCMLDSAGSSPSPRNCSSTLKACDACSVRQARTLTCVDAYTAPVPTSVQPQPAHVSKGTLGIKSRLSVWCAQLLV